MRELIRAFGPWGPIMLVLAVVVLTLALRAAWTVARPRGQGSSSLADNAKALLFWGVAAAVLGFLGQCIAAFMSLTTILAAPEISPAVVAEGFVISFLPTLAGLGILTFAAAAWGCIRFILARGEGRATPVPSALLLPFPLLVSATLALGGIGCSDSPDAAADRIRQFAEGGTSVVEVPGLWSSDWPDLPGVSVDTLVGPRAGDDLGLVAPLHAAFLSSGRMLLADVGTSRVWIGTRAGEWREGPGPGPGPGEFRAIGGIWAKDAGFVVHDPQAGDLIHFDEQGRLVQRHPVGTDAARHGSGVRTGPWPPTVQHLGGGNWLVAVAGPPEGIGSGSVMQGQFRFTWVFGTPPHRELEIGVGPTRPVFVQGGGGAPIPFAPSALAAGAAGRVAIFGGKEPTIEVVQEVGQVALRVQWTDMPGPVDEAHRGALGAYMRAVAPQGAPAAVLHQMIASLNEALPYPKTLPHLGDLRLGMDGTIWLGWPERSGLETQTEPELVREWRVMVPGSGDDRPGLFRVLLPAGTTLLGPAGVPGEVGDRGGLGPEGEGAFFLLLRDEVGRQGIGVLRYGAGLR